jgi:N-methylhydantoinase B
VRVRRGEARASMVMDHGRTGPQGALNGSEGGANTVRFDFKDGSTHTPLHLSKEQDITVRPGDVIDVCTPGGGGYGNPSNRDPQKVQDDIRKGYYSAEQSATLFPIKGSE